MTDLFGVWTPAVVIAAILAGLGFGYVFTDATIRTPYFVALAAPPRFSGLLTAIGAVLAGILFYVGQVAGALAGGDPLWARILSRFTLWLVYALFMGLGAYLAAKRDESRRHARARAKALSEHGKQP